MAVRRCFRTPIVTSLDLFHSLGLDLHRIVGVLTLETYD